MHRNPFLLAVTLLLAAMATGAAAAAARQPNVVFLLIDDLGRADCGFMGSDEIRTPHIDKLAAAGAKLDAFYVQPLCSPTRAALMTGRYPMRHGLQVGVVKPWAQFGLPLDERTLAQDLQAAGYVTGIFGKWHLGLFEPAYLPMQRGFDRQYGHYNGALDYFTHERDGGFDWHKDDKICRDEGYATTLIGAQAARFVADNAGRNPFFLYVPFNAVHSPYQAPEEYRARYPDLTGQRKNYAAMLTAADDAIAEIVAAVEQAGVRDDTLFVFASDNGGPAPGRITDNGDYRGGKGGLYEGGVRVVAFATWDGRIEAGATISAPMHIVDWRPTLQRLCGAPPADGPPMDGADIWPTLTEGAPSPHDVILLNSAPGASAVRAGDWKLVVHKAAGGQEGARRRGQARGQARRRGVELFNLASDPGEKTNVAEKHPDKVQELQRALAEFAAQAVPPKARPMPSDYAAPAVWGEAG